MPAIAVLLILVTFYIFIRYMYLLGTYVHKLFRIVLENSCL